jgi:hypothetical protein
MNTSHVTRVAAAAAVLLAVQFSHKALGAAITGIDPRSTITATMDAGTGLTGNTWYEVGVNTSSNKTGLVTGLVNGQTDPLSTYLIPGAVGDNALMLDTGTKTGTLTLGRALPLAGFSFAGSSGNGAGTLTPTLHFSDGSTDTLPSVSVGDWFNNSPIVETAQGRIDVVANSFNNVGAANPRVLAIDESVPTADQSKLVTSIDLSWTGGSTTHTAIFGLSADVTGLGHYTAIPVTGFNRDIIVGLKEVPEPGTLALFGIGALGLFIVSRRKSA